MPKNIGETKQPVKVDDWADEIFVGSEPLSAKKGKKSL